MPPSLDEVRATVLENLAAVPFYGDILVRPVRDFLGRCVSPGEALRSRIVRHLYLGTQRWTETVKLFAVELSRICSPERALPRFRKGSGSMTPREAGREFDQAALSVTMAWNRLRCFRKEEMHAGQTLSRVDEERGSRSKRNDCAAKVGSFISRMRSTLGAQQTWSVSAALGPT